jgi:hypothetical protein
MSADLGVFWEKAEGAIASANISANLGVQRTMFAIIRYET